MKILIASIGKLSIKSEEKNLFDEYIKRIPWQIDIKEIDKKFQLPVNIIRVRESEALLSVSKGNYIITLDETGELYSSYDFARFLKNLESRNTNKIAFLIGGAHGHDKSIYEKSNIILSLSKLTFPHIFAKILLIEQIYRAYTINSGHPYHK